MAESPPRPGAEENAARYVQAIGEVGHLPKESVFKGPYRRLFAAQVVSSFGDWLGFLAITAQAAEIGGKTNGAVAISVVLSARLLPGFFFGAFASGLLDRWDRKKIMITCDVGRGLIYASIPFIHNVAGLFGVSLVLELLTLMWTPAKEASVPNLVPPENLAGANSAGMAAAYGTILPAIVFFPALAFIADVLGSHVHWAHILKGHNSSIAIYIDVLSFFCSAFLISRLPLPGKTEHEKANAPAISIGSTFRDAKEGWQYIGQTYRVRAVIVGFCIALIGGGMTLPLGTSYSTIILHKGATGFGLLELALGLGVAAGVLSVSVVQKRLGHGQFFVMSMFVGGAALVFAASMANLALVMLGIGLMGAATGSVYVLGYTILGTEVSDEIRGRIFGAFYTLVRLCLLLALVVAPLIAGILDHIAQHLTRHAGTKVIHGEVGTSAFHVALPGARLTLWLGGGIILGGSWFARRDFRKAAAGRGVDRA